MNKSIIASACFLSGVAITSMYHDVNTVSFDENVVFNNVVNMYPDAKDDVYKIVLLADNMVLILLSSGDKLITNVDGTVVVHSMSRLGMSAYTLTNDKITDIVNEVRSKINKEIVNNDLIDPIVYKSVNEKMELNVFIEPFCGYCQVLHNNIQNYLDAGFTIKYYPLPIYGERSEKIFQSIWSIEDKETRKNEIDRVLKEISLRKEGATYTIEELSLDKSTEEGMISTTLNTESGRRMGINSTPALVTNEGKMISGAVPPEKLKQIFKLN